MLTADALVLADSGSTLAISGPEAVGLGIIGVGVFLLLIALALLAIVHRRRRDRMRR